VPRPDQEVGTIGQQGPSVDRPGFGLHQGGQAGDKVRVVRVLPEDDAPLEPPHHDVAEGLRGIQAGLARYGDYYLVYLAGSRNAPASPSGGRQVFARHGGKVVLNEL
jgi:hypothetical protein